MNSRLISALLLNMLMAVAASGAAAKHHDPGSAKTTINRHDPAFRIGYLDGYRQGSNDSEALSNSYRDESGPVYAQAEDGYSPQYGDLSHYQQVFRRGYIEGYKAGWDFNSGQYTPLGAGGGGGAGG